MGTKQVIGADADRMEEEVSATASFALEYILTQQEIQNHMAYGITVIKDSKEKASTGPICLHKGMILRLLQKLMDCNITPCVLNEVVDDWFDTIMAEAEEQAN